MTQPLGCRRPRFEVLVILGVLALALLWQAGCGTGLPAVPSGDAGSGDGGSVPGDAGVGPTLPCAVAEVLARRCQSCHGATPQFGAPMSLVTYADLHAPAPNVSPPTPVYQVVEQRIHSTTLPMPQPPNPPLDSADMATMDSWVGAGAPAGAACGPGDGGAPDAGGPPASDSGSIALPCTPDTVLKPASPWSMPQNANDAYVCYGFDVDPASPRQVTAMAPHIDNSAIVHHIVLFQAPSSVSATPALCNPEADWSMVYIWAPGGSSFTLPADIGFDEDSPTHWVVQVHYDNIKHMAGQQDSSGFGLCTTDNLRPNHAGIAAFGSTSFTIPAHGTLDLTCDSQLPGQGEAFNVFAAMPHMHLLGKSISSVIDPAAGGAPVTLDDVTAWNFENQRWYPVTATLHGGDTVTTECDWSNTTGAPVSFGPYTEDEMCYSFLMYYPRISAPGWAWNTMATTATCTGK